VCGYSVRKDCAITSKTHSAWIRTSPSYRGGWAVKGGERKGKERKREEKEEEDSLEFGFRDTDGGQTLSE
jgi:hypothetical protein